MDYTHSVAISVRDFLKLYDLVSVAQYTTNDDRAREQLELLDEELSRAKLFHDEELPDGIVKMNSIVEYEDLDNGKVSKAMIVYPHQAEAERGRISVLAPVGAALIGLKVGQSITWPLPNGNQKSIKVLSVTNF